MRINKIAHPKTMSCFLKPIKYTFLIYIFFPMHAMSDVAYTPDWAARHKLQILVDHAGLKLPMSHWPLPTSAIESALDDMPTALNNTNFDIESIKAEVKNELKLSRRPILKLGLRTKSEPLNGFDKDPDQGNSAEFISGESEINAIGNKISYRLGVKGNHDRNPAIDKFSNQNLLESTLSATLENSNLVLNGENWNIQAFNHHNWWGPGWQSSLINGNNSLSWSGIGSQRSRISPSKDKWLSWMGPWTAEIYLAQAQDPIVYAGQPRNYWFSAMRVSMMPWSWLEIAFSRTIQFGGSGRPNDPKSLVKAFLGQEVNKNPDDSFTDSSNQLGGYDIRLRCPFAEKSCSVYTQIIGEDAAGKIPLPSRHITLWGIDTTFVRGRFRGFAELSNTNINSLPWENSKSSAGYLNGVYTQGYTNGGRWIGSAQGSGSRVLTTGLIDSESGIQIKIHKGTIGQSIGVYWPNTNLQRGEFLSAVIKKDFRSQDYKISFGFDLTEYRNNYDSFINPTRHFGVSAIISKNL
jgi:Capsule assembly protein Wzi